MRIRIILLSFLVIFSILSSCTYDINETNSILENSVNSNDELEIGSDAAIVDEMKQYTLYRSNNLYYYSVYDINNNIIKSAGPLTDKPRFEMVGKIVLRITTQGGTGIGTQSGYYCNLETGKISRVFDTIFDQCNGKVAYGNKTGIVIQDIFENTGTVIEITSFSYPLASVVMPIIKACFSEDGTEIYVTYLSGGEYKEITECLCLT